MALFVVPSCVDSERHPSASLPSVKSKLDAYKEAHLESIISTSLCQKVVVAIAEFPFSLRSFPREVATHPPIFPLEVDLPSACDFVIFFF